MHESADNDDIDGVEEPYTLDLVEDHREYKSEKVECRFTISDNYVNVVSRLSHYVDEDTCDQDLEQ